ncbi:iron permease [Mycena galopus ATCC 62051]|nr:iron permease [Mycena galopus ATCC 62051]
MDTPPCDVREDAKPVDLPVSYKPETSSRQLRLAQILPIMVALCLALFLSALELTAVSTALPTIVASIHDYKSTDFIWVGSAYSLAATAFLPFFGALAQVFGRRPVILGSLCLFSVGSALCGASNSEAQFLGGRSIQGIGGGGIVALTNLILADLVPLHKRGNYNAFLGLTWSIASIVGPFLGGLLAERGAWRWLFYLNLPLCAIVTALILRFLNLRAPKESLAAKIKHLDFIGNFIVIGSTAACVLSLTQAGALYSWNSFHVLVPLCLGLVGIVIFFVYEARLAEDPMVPSFLWTNRTSISGYIQTFLVQAQLLCFVYYLPVYFQASKLASPMDSGLDMFGLALSLAPISVIVGFSVAIFRCYRPQLWVGWSIMVLSMGLLSTVTENSHLWLAIGYCILVGAGMGTAYTATMFPVLAPLPVSANAQAVALAMFLRLFGQVWGVTIGGAILQNGLARLSTEVVQQISGGDVAYGTIAVLPRLPVELQLEVRTLFASALATLWRVMAGISGVGLVASLMMRQVPMHTYTDENWGVAEERADTPQDPSKSG